MVCHSIRIGQCNPLTMAWFCGITVNQIHQPIYTLSDTLWRLVSVYRFLSLFGFTCFFIKILILRNVLYRTMIVISSHKLDFSGVSNCLIKQAYFSDLLGTFLLCRILNGHTVTRCSKESSLIWDFKKRIRDFSELIVENLMHRKSQ